MLCMIRIGDREGGYAVHDQDREHGGWLCCAWSG